MSVESPPRVRKTTSEIDFSQTAEWLAQNRLNYIGKWVVLDGGRLIGSGDDPRPIVAQALAALLNEVGKSLKPRVRCIINPRNRGAGIPDGGLFTPDQFQKHDKSEPI